MVKKSKLVARASLRSSQCHGSTMTNAVESNLSDALSQSGQSRLHDGKAVNELLANLIDGCDQIVVVDLLPQVVGERAANC